VSNTKYKSTIVQMKPIRRADGGVTYIPQRQQGPDAGQLMELDPMQLAQQQSASQPVQERLTGDYKSRAVGFSIKTWQLSAIFGAAMWLLARLAGGFPLLSIKALLVMLLGFGLVWLAAFLADLLLSPAGVAWYNARRLWNHLDKEQAERHRFYRSKYND